MADLSRRRFLRQTSLGAGSAVLGAAALSQLAAAAPAPPAPAADPSAAPAETPLPAPGLEVELAESVVIHVRDLATAEVALFTGTQEIVYYDPQLVARLRQASGPSSDRAEVGHVLAP